MKNPINSLLAGLCASFLLVACDGYFERDQSTAPVPALPAEILLTPSATVTHTLRVTVLGSGTIRSAPTGIDCGSDCTEAYANGTIVALTPVAAAGMRFAGWGGACSGTGVCRVSMTSMQSVNAMFEAIPSYTLTVNKAGEGQVLSSPAGIDCGSDCSEAYIENQQVTLSAAPAAGFRFGGWLGACSNATGDCTVTLSANQTVGAVFEKLRFPLTVSQAGGEGVVSSTPVGINCGSDCSEDYDSGQQVTLMATAASGFRFLRWDGACTGASCTVTMSEARTVSAVFEAIPSFPLTVGVSGDGRVTAIGIDCPGDCDQNYSDNEQVTLTALAGSGYRFKNWTGDCSGTAACVVTMSAARAVTAVFEVIPSYTLSVDKSLGDGLGTVSSTPAGISCGNDCTEDYVEATSVSLTAVAGANSVFAGWGGPCSGTAACTVAMDMARTVTARFTLNAVVASCHADDALSVAEAPLPGPPLMRMAAPDAPILRHCNGAASCAFKAMPLMVAGHEKYDQGEYLYQDYVFDDFGAETTGGPFNTSTITSPATGNATPDAANFRSGDIAYPSNTAKYGDNAADLVELRIVPRVSDVLYRVTLNTLLAKDSTLVAIAWNKDAVTTGGSSTLVPTGATTIAQGSHGSSGVTVPGTDEVIYLWNNTAGGGGQHVAFSSTGAGTVTSLVVDVDLASNQMTVSVPRSTHSPSGTAWKYVAMTGLHNGSGSWVLPTQNASATVPGGSGTASPNPPAIFDLNNHQAIVNGQSGGKTGELCHYLDTPCDTVQAIALRQVNGFAAPALTAYARAVNFDALANGVVASTVPAEGAANPDKKSLVRLFASRIVTTPAEGHERSADQGNASSSGSGLSGVPANDRIFFYGPLQSYSIYVPTGYRAATAAPLTWSNHSLAQFHWQYNGTRFVQEAGEKRGSLVVTSNSRATDGFFTGRNEIDHFEVWADVLRNYSVDQSRTAVTGYSMGGYGTYRQATQYPDLFTKAYSVVGPPGAGVWKGTGGVGSGTGTSTAEEYYTLTNFWLENLRNVPIFNMAVETDYLVPIGGPRQQNIGSTAAGDQSLEGLGYRYTYQEFQSGEHLTLFANDSYPMVKDFLGTEAIDANPAHVTFSYVPDSNFTHTGSDGVVIPLKHDHAYWVSQLVLRTVTPPSPATQNKSSKGTIDVLSLAFGRADAVAAAQTTTPGTLMGGYVSPALAYTQYQKNWAAPLAITIENKLVLKLTNLSAVNVDALRAALNTGSEVVIDSTSDGATQLNLAAVFASHATRTVTEDGVALCTAKVGPNGARIPVKSGTHVYRISRP